MATREELAQEYTVNAHGNITSPGKFEGEALYVPYFWDAYLNGGADEDDGETLVFDICPDDIREFPELAEFKLAYLWEDANGFVGCELIQ